MSLFNSKIGKALDKSQNKFTAIEDKKIESQLVDYMIAQGADTHGLKELASQIRLICFSDRLNKTASTAPDVLLSSIQKIDSMVLAGQMKIEELDASGEFDKMMAEIHDNIDRHDNPEAYI